MDQQFLAVRGGGEGGQQFMVFGTGQQFMVQRKQVNGASFHPPPVDRQTDKVRTSSSLIRSVIEASAKSF